MTGRDSMSSQRLLLELCGVRLAPTTILDPYMDQLMTVLVPLLQQVGEMNQNLSGIHEELKRKTILASSGGAGADGFANVVYNFVKMHIKHTTRKNDLFFLWHPDTSWHPVFYEIIARNPLPNTFCGESTDLNKLCNFMKVTREAMNRKHHYKKQPVFHLLIPSWYNIRWVEPVHFPDEILPLRVVGPTHDMGRPLVSFCLPFQQDDLRLEGVGNSVCEKDLEGAGDDSTALIVGGLAGAAFCIATGGMFGLSAAVVAIMTAIGSSGNEERQQKEARILGSPDMIYRPRNCN